MLRRLVARRFCILLFICVTKFPTLESFSVLPATLLNKNTRHWCASRGGSHVVRMSGAISNEDEWYDSDKWEALTKSKARVVNPRESARPTDEEETEGARSRSESGREVNAQQTVEWLNLVGCDICLPKDRRKPIDGGPRFACILHFIGGVFAGSYPGQAYQRFIESLAIRNRFIIIATPFGTGMDHYKAAYEASLKFKSACDALEAELGADIFRASDFPHIGIGHSLGCKIHIVLNSVGDCRRSAGRRRAANVLIAYNNYGVKESVPIFSELAEVQRTFQTAAAAAAPTLKQVASVVKENQAIQDIMSAVTGSNQAATQVLDLLGKIGAAAERLGANAEARQLDEFSPTPAETDQLLANDYAVGRNLVVKFLNDNIDQSIPLCQALRTRFTAPDTGRGGFLQLKRLPGFHVTPNIPYYSVEDPDGVLKRLNMEELVRAQPEQLEALCDEVAAFAAAEAARAALLPDDLEDGTLLGPA